MKEFVNIRINLATAITPGLPKIELSAHLFFPISIGV